MIRSVMAALAATLLCVTGAAQAALAVFACEPEWGALVQELGGERVSVYTATTARQDPHRIEARPSLIAQARRARLVVCTGAELEAGWLPVVLAESANRNIQPGQPGLFYAADHVALLEKPARLDRAMGDLHAAGNPHIQTDPRNIARVAAALAIRLAQVDPDGAALYRARHADFAQRWQAAIARWEREAAPLRGVPVVVQHNGFPYLENWLGLVRVAVLEPKPGVPPSLTHLARVKDTLARTPARLVLRAAYMPARPSEWIARETGIAVVELPYTVGGDATSTDLFGLFDSTVRRLREGLR